MKPIAFLGSALSDLRAFPAVARQEAGYQLERVQRGLEPYDWKPMASIGAGVREIRIRGSGGAFRVIYIATLADRVYVLHAFQKKVQRTARRDIDLVKLKLRALMAEMR